MNNINFSRARNGTRIALNKNHLILLVALAVLSLAIVFLSVSYNLNALATDNIAFADEVETRGLDTSNGLVRANYIPYNWGDFWDFNNTATSTETVIYTSDDLTISIYGSGSIVGNTITLNSSSPFNIVFNFITGASKPRVALQYASAFGYTLTSGAFTVLDQRYINGSYNSSSMSVLSSYCYNARSVSNKYLDNSSFLRWNFIASTTPCVFDLDWVYFNNESSFSGYVSPNYQNYGYNQGYQDGLNAGGGSSTPSDFTNDTGLVGSNILKYNYWLDSDFDSSSQGTTTIWEDTENTQKIDLVHATLQNNVLTPYVESREREERVAVRTASMIKYFVPHRNNNAETFAVYVSAISGSWELGLMNTSNFVILSQGLNVLYIPATESERVATETYNIYTLDSNASITISWMKLETGTSFTGYVAPDNANSYESGYEQGLIDGYYNGVTDLNTIKTVLNNVPMETRTPYYAINVTESPYGVNNDYMDITYHISSAVSGVTYGNYIPIIFNLAYNVPVGLDLFWKFDGAILNPHSSAVDPNGSSTIYYGFYDSISFVSYGPEFAPYQETISWPSSSVSDYEVVFHASYSGNYLVLWFYTDNENPYYEFGIRTPVVDGSYNSNPFYFEYNPYTLTDSSVNLDNARQQGYQEGFNSGYNRGKFENSVTGQYTFKNLIGSVFDAPITALLGTYDEREGARVGGLLNFEVLGVNLGGFVIGLLSLAIILFVLRVFMRGL